jgi:transporter family protein
MAKRRSGGARKEVLSSVDEAVFLRHTQGMLRPYVVWALVGMLGYSLTTLFMKLAIREGRLTGYLVLAVATSMTASTALIICLTRQETRGLGWADLFSPSAGWAIATGLAMAVGVSALFRGLSLGPASVVVPIYCMFSAGGALLGMIFLHEPVTLRRLLGLALAAVSVFLIAGNPSR